MYTTSHVCYGSECPQCGVFAHNYSASDKNTHQRLSAFSDSLGLPVVAWPHALNIGVTGILIRYQEGRGLIAGRYFIDMLVHQRSDNGWWGFPGGRMEIGETVLDCLVREMYEETGYTVTPLELMCIDSDPTEYAICQYPDGNIVHYCALTFLCVTKEAFSQEPRCSAESTHVKWLRLHDDLQLPRPFLPAHLWRYEKANILSRIAYPDHRIRVSVR